MFLEELQKMKEDLRDYEDIRTLMIASAFYLRNNYILETIKNNDREIRESSKILVPIILTYLKNVERNEIEVSMETIYIHTEDLTIFDSSRKIVPNEGISDESLKGLNDFIKEKLEEMGVQDPNFKIEN